VNLCRPIFAVLNAVNVEKADSLVLWLLDSRKASQEARDILAESLDMHIKLETGVAQKEPEVVRHR